MRFELKIIILFGVIIAFQSAYLIYLEYPRDTAQASVLTYTDCENLYDNYAKTIQILNASCDTATFNKIEEFGVNGIYVPSTNIACMRTDVNYKNTKMHEQCHGFVDHDYNHFCIDYK